MSENKKNLPHLDEEIIKSIPRWHFAMLNDKERNYKFKNAIEQSNLKNKIVLDIGTGTGFLSMLAIQQGAKHVYTCEANSHVAQMAKRIIEKNGLSKNITVINKLSTELLIGLDIPDKVDVLISETVDCGFFGEGFGYSLNHAKKHLLKQGALIIPHRMELSCALINSDKIAHLNHVSDNTLGFTLSLFNEFKTPGYFPVRVNTWEHKIISSKEVVMNANFYTENCFDNNYQIGIDIQNSMVAHGVLFWFTLELADGIFLSNSPSNLDSHWMQAFQPFDKPIDVVANTKIHLTCNTSDFGIEFNSYEQHLSERKLAVSIN